MRRWLARLAFSFIIIAALLAWEGMRAAGWRAGLLYGGALVALFIGMAGIRERHALIHEHRPDRNGDGGRDE